MQSSSSRSAPAGVVLEDRMGTSFLEEISVKEYMKRGSLAGRRNPIVPYLPGGTRHRFVGIRKRCQCTGLVITRNKASVSYLLGRTQQMIDPEL